MSERHPRDAGTVSPSVEPREDDWVERFEAPERVLWQKPAEVIAALNVRRGDRVADVGAGTGYFALPLGRAVGRGGVVHAIEVDRGRVEHLARRVVAERATMVKPALGTPEDPRLLGPVDLVFLCNTYHHIGHRRTYLGHLAAALAPGGRVVVIDWLPRDLPIGPPRAVKVRPTEVIAEMRSAHLTFVGRETFLPHQYYLSFARWKG